MKLSEKDIERFWNKVNIKEPNECWLWKGCIGKDGYGQLWVQGRTMHAILKEASHEGAIQRSPVE